MCCGRCGLEAAVGDRFCRRCGAELASTGSEPPGLTPGGPDRGGEAAATPDDDQAAGFGLVAAEAVATGASEDPRRPRKRVVGVVMVTSLVLVVAGSWAAATRMTKQPARTLSGTLTVYDGNSFAAVTGTACEGAGFADDLASGSSLIVEDQAQRVIAAGVVGAGQMTGDGGCMIRFSIPKVPAAKYYRVRTASHLRDGQLFSRQELDHSQWRIGLEIGDSAAARQKAQMAHLTSPDNCLSVGQFDIERATLTDVTHVTKQGGYFTVRLAVRNFAAKPVTAHLKVRLHLGSQSLSNLITPPQDWQQDNSAESFALDYEVYEGPVTVAPGRHTADVGFMYVGAVPRRDVTTHLLSVQTTGSLAHC